MNESKKGGGVFTFSENHWLSKKFEQKNDNSLYEFKAADLPTVFAGIAQRASH
jgi:hypothetical protein